MAAVDSPPMLVVVTGVAGSGKTTIGQQLAKDQGWPFFDADEFHPKANIEKMRQGIGLQDEDRWPWLDALAARMRELIAEGRSAVFACSALKEAYRARLRIDPAVRFVHLTGDFDLIQRRLMAREGHYAKADLLKSQFEALEEPSDVPKVDVAVTPAEVVAKVKQVLGIGAS